MSNAGGGRRATAEIQWAKDPAAVVWVGQRTLHHYWPLLSPYFRDVLLPPLRRSEDECVAWSWREADGNRAPTASELTNLRKRIVGDQRSFADSVARRAGSDEERGARSHASVEEIGTVMDAVVGDLVAKADAEFTRFVCRTEAGLRLHCWGAPVAARPTYPDERSLAVSGVVLVAGKPEAGHDVALIDERGVEVTQVRSETRGRFRFDNVAPGSYRARVVSQRAIFPREGTAIAINRDSIEGIELRSVDDSTASVHAADVGSSRRARGWRRAGVGALLILGFGAFVAAWKYGFSKRVETMPASSIARPAADRESNAETRSARGVVSQGLTLMDTTPASHAAGGTSRSSVSSDGPSSSSLRERRASALDSQIGQLGNPVASLGQGGSELERELLAQTSPSKPPGAAAGGPSLAPGPITGPTGATSPHADAAASRSALHGATNDPDPASTDSPAAAGVALDPVSTPAASRPKRSASLRARAPRGLAEPELETAAVKRRERDPTVSDTVEPKSEATPELASDAKAALTEPRPVLDTRLSEAANPISAERDRDSADADAMAASRAPAVARSHASEISHATRVDEHDGPSSSDSAHDSETPTASRRAADEPIGETPLRVMQVEISTWEPRLVGDAILPTLPEPQDTRNTLNALREAALQEKRAQLPASFRRPAMEIGYVLQFDRGADVAAFAWQHAPAADALDSRSSNSLPGLAAPSAEVGENASTGVHGNRAEIAWPKKGSSRMRSTLRTDAGRVLAVFHVDGQGGQSLRLADDMVVTLWISARIAADDDLATATIASAAPRFTWDSGAGFANASTAPGRGPSDSSLVRLELPFASVPGTGVRSLALVDRVTGWALRSELRWTVSSSRPR